MFLNEHSSNGSLLYMTDKVSAAALAIVMDLVDTALAETTNVSVTRFMCSQSVH